MKYTQLEIAGMLQDNNDTINELKADLIKANDRIIELLEEKIALQIQEPTN